MKGSNFQLILLFVFGFAVVVALLIFSGVLPGFKSAPGGTGGHVVLWGPVPESESLKAFLAKFGEDNNASFTFEYQSKDPATYEGDLIEALASGNGPDLFFVTNEMLLRDRDKLLTIPFTSFSERSYRDTFAQAGDVFVSPRGDGIYAMPVAIDPMVMYYNRDMLNTAGVAKPPATWTDFLADQRLLTQADSQSNISQSEAALGSFSNISNAKEIVLMLLNQAGNSVVVKDTEHGGYMSILSDSLGYSPSPAEAAFSFFTQFANPTKTTYTWNRALPEARDTFVSSSLATYFGFASEAPVIKAKNPHLNFDVALVPQKDLNQKITYGRLYGVAITKASKNPATAVAALAQLVNKDNDAALAKVMGLIPARQDLFGEAQNDPFADIFYRSALISRSFLDPNPTQTKNIFRTLTEEVQSGTAGVTEAIETAQNEMLLLLK